MKLNKVMLKYGVIETNFKRFLADIAHVYWNVIRIILGLEIPFMRMVNRE
jgi:hypothetical protein